MMKRGFISLILLLIVTCLVAFTNESKCYAEEKEPVINVIIVDKY